MELYTGEFSNAKGWDLHSCYTQCHKVMSLASSAPLEKGLGKNLSNISGSLVSIEISKAV